ncbi:MAG: hypothetical protein ACTSUE_21755 [Promethearchaeota archaeon]
MQVYSIIHNTSWIGRGIEPFRPIPEGPAGFPGKKRLDLLERWV